MKKISLVLIILFLMTGCKPQPPEISYQNADFNFVSLEELDADFKFKIANPNNMPLQGKIDYDLRIDGKDFLSGETDKIEVNAEDESSFTIKTRINYVKIFGTVSKIAEDYAQGKRAISYQLNGTYRAEVFLFPVEVPMGARGDMPLPEIKLEDVSLDQLKEQFKL